MKMKTRRSFVGVFPRNFSRILILYHCGLVFIEYIFSFQKKGPIKRKEKNKSKIELRKMSCSFLFLRILFHFIIKQQLSQLKSKIMTFNYRLFNLQISILNISLNVPCLHYFRGSHPYDYYFIIISIKSSVLDLKFSTREKNSYIDLSSKAMIHLKVNNCNVLAKYFSFQFHRFTVS